MLKKRLIPVLFIMNGQIVRSERFCEHKIIGNIINEAHRYNDWDVDELIYIDISRERYYDSRRDDHKIASYRSIEEIITAISKVCFMPLAFGGGIRTFEDASLRIERGADKVVINSEALRYPELITMIADQYGVQCVVVSIDYRIISGQPVVFTDFGQTNTGWMLFDWMAECEQRGAGEFFLNAIDRDGKANGYDVETIALAAQKTRRPVIACGGAGDFFDFVDLAKQTEVSGLAAGNIFHFTERSYPRAKKMLLQNGILVRGG
jgi:cyclase